MRGNLFLQITTNNEGWQFTWLGPRSLPQALFTTMAKGARIFRPLRCAGIYSCKSRPIAKVRNAPGLIQGLCRKRSNGLEFLPSSFNLWLEANIRLRCAMLFSSFPSRPGGYVRFNVSARTYELAFTSSGVHYLAGRNRKRFRQRRATRAGTSFPTNLRSVRRTGEAIFRTELPMSLFFPSDEGRVRGSSIHSGALEFIPANYDQ